MIDSFGYARENLDSFEAIELFFENGWTDGLPIVPPSESLVQAMLTESKLKPDEVVGSIAPSGNPATVIGVAICAVMAGCKPEYFPVVLAAVEAIADERLNLNGIQATTHVAAPLIIINGPIRKALEINSGYNVFGQGWRANATIGRAIRLIMIIIGEGRPGITDQSTFGHPGKYTYCIAENEEESPWKPLHVDLGYAQEDSTVTVMAAEAPHSITDHLSKDPYGILLTASDTLATMGCNGSRMTNFSLLALGVEHVKTIAKSEWTKRDVKLFVYNHARISFDKLSYDGRYGKIWNRYWPRWVDRKNGEMIPVIEHPDDLIVIVAGGPVGRFSAAVPGWNPSSRPVTKKIRVE